MNLRFIVWKRDLDRTVLNLRWSCGPLLVTALRVRLSLWSKWWVEIKTVFFFDYSHIFVPTRNFALVFGNVRLLLNNLDFAPLVFKDKFGLASWFYLYVPKSTVQVIQLQHQERRLVVFKVVLRRQVHWPVYFVLDLNKYGKIVV
jgi:hypothetical protein